MTPNGALLLLALVCYFAVQPSAAQTNDPLMFTSQPMDATVERGVNTTITAEVNTLEDGDTVQWFFGGVGLSNGDRGGRISGVDTLTLMITNVMSTDQGDYSVQVTRGSDPAIMSNTATLTVECVIILTQPVDRDVAAGNNVTFFVVLQNPAGTYIRWQRGSTLTEGSKYIGTRTESLTITDAQNADMGEYRVLLFNAVEFCSINSEAGTLTVVTEPIMFTSQPMDATVERGVNTTITAEVNTLEDGGTVKWFFGLVGLTNGDRGGRITGADTLTLMITNVMSTDQGDYSVQVTRGTDPAIVSNTATLTVECVIILTHPVDRNVVAGDNVTFFVVLQNPAGTNIRWQRGSTLTEGSKYIGTRTESLTITDAQNADMGEYRVFLINVVEFCTLNSESGTLTVVDPPTIMTQPMPVTVADGTPSVTFTVVASSEDNVLMYQWRLNDMNLTDEILQSLVLMGPLSNADEGNYSVVVTNGFDLSTTSDDAMLTVITDPVIVVQPVDTAVPFGDTAAFLTTVTGEGTLTFEWFFRGNPLSDVPGQVFGSAEEDIAIIDVQAGDLGSYQLRVTNNVGRSVTSDVVNLGELLPPSITMEPEHRLNQVPGSNITFSVTVTGILLTFQWERDGSPLSNDDKYSGVNTATLTVINVQESDEGHFAVRISNNAGEVTSAIVILSVLDHPVIKNHPDSVLDAAEGTDVTFTVLASGEMLTYEWFITNNIVTKFTLSDNDNIGGSDSPTLTIISVTPSFEGTYYARVTNDAGAVTSDEASLIVVPLECDPEVFGSSPSSQNELRSVAVTNGVVTYNGVIPGSVATLQCDSGYVPISNTMVVCQNDSHWNETELSCQNIPVVTNTLSNEASIAIAVVVTFLLTLVLGVSIGALSVWGYYKCRRSNRVTLQPPTEMSPIDEEPEYDVIKPDPLTDGNLAYGNIQVLNSGQ